MDYDNKTDWYRVFKSGTKFSQKIQNKCRGLQWVLTINNAIRHRLDI